MAARGRIGSSTQLHNAKDAGITFTVPRYMRKKFNKQRRQLAQLKKAATSRPPIDLHPRLVKREN